jgi:hypothetical protein
MGIESVRVYDLFISVKGALSNILQTFSFGRNMPQDKSYIPEVTPLKLLPKLPPLKLLPKLPPPPLKLFLKKNR